MGSMDTSSTTDVLIVGAGPAGLMASMYLSEHDVPHRIVDISGTRTLNGRSDGFHVRTIEIWDSFGISDRLHKYGVPYGDWGVWTQEDDRGISRHHISDIAGERDSRLSIGAIHQGYIEAALNDAAIARGGPRVERGTTPVALEVGTQSEYPVKIRLRRGLKSELPQPRAAAHTLQKDGTHKPERGFIDCFGTDPTEIVPRVDGVEGREEIVRAKYVIGADGAHSWVRHQLPGVTMKGDSTTAVWGVIDIIPITDWPDIRRACNVVSRNGSCVAIPREHNLVRLYVQFPDDYSAENSHSRTDGEVVCRDIMEVARKIFAPYTMDYVYCDWWTLYRVGQRVATKNSHLDRVFLAGDAVHTHSPKAGQGMNVSQQDTYNLSWKLAGVLRGQLDPSVLHTYAEERLPAAHELMRLDREMTKMLTARENFDINVAERVHDMVKKQNGTHLLYDASSLIAKPEECQQSAATKIPLGMRLSDAQVYSQANGVSSSVQTLLKSDGSWRLLVFGGDASKAEQLRYINSFGDRIAKLAQRYPAASPRLQHWLQVLLLHSSSTSDVELADFHDAYYQTHPIYGRNYFTIFGGSAPNSTGKNAHEVYEVAEKGALVVVRPDQFVAWLGTFEDMDKMENWFAKFMIQ
ncbi:putative FAD-binding domain, phenol hydroxylase dimerization domain, Thioredoxin-like superfamily [Septoria linicola]|nr:putative FAD-binding domain, phenol hydroxylase dimerization domain, Thioredoxin-like superfamily [Septoria linicola]